MAWASDWKSKAKNAASSLKAEYEAGRTGDDSPAQPLWSSPQQQLDAMVAMLKSFRSKPDDAPSTVTDDGPTATESNVSDTATDRPTADATDSPNEETADTADAGKVAEALRRVDWAGVRSATAERTGEATKAMRSMAEQVDWDKVQPVAAQVSRALIAAVASGQLGLGGGLGPTVARTIAGQSGLGQRVAQQLQNARVTLPTDLPELSGTQHVIPTTATES